MFIIIFHILCCFKCGASHFRFNLQPRGIPKLGSGDRDEAVNGLLANLSVRGLSLHLIRPIPPRFPVDEREVGNILGLDILLVTGLHFFF